MVAAAKRFFPILVLLSGCVSASKSVPAAWMSVPVARRIASLSLDREGKVAVSAEPAPARTSSGPIRVEGDPIKPRLMSGSKPLTEPFEAIDSFDYSESRREVIFSAKRDDGFDIGLVSSDGGTVNWLPADPADEIAVQWAPRGNKVSYVVRAAGGDVVRTFHVPTSYALAVPFADATIHALAWDPQAEHYAVAYSTADASDRVEVMEYDGGARRTAIEPAEHLDVVVEPLVPGAIVLRPVDVKYDEKLPVVIWVASDFGWNDGRAALIRSARVATVVTRSAPGDALWKAVDAAPWIDTTRAFVVSPHAVPSRSAFLITGDASLTGAQWRRTGSTVSVSPAVVQSFAAGFIADQLKRTTPTNVSSR